MKKKLGRELYQVTPLEKYNADEDELSVCESVIKGFKTIFLLIAKQQTKL